MSAPSQQDLDDIVAAFEARGLKVIHAHKHAHYGRMITIVIDEGDPDVVTGFEIWPEGFMPGRLDEIARIAAESYAVHGPDGVYEIGDNPRVR